MDAEAPSESAAIGDGRDRRNGRFAPGNQLSKGNVTARRVARLRSEILRSETPEDVAAVIAAMRAKAMGGDAVAAKVYLDRVLGPVTPIEVQTRIADLEAELASAVELLRSATALANAQPVAAEVRKAG